MLVDRLKVAAIMLPVGLAAIHFGGPFYLTVITVILLLAAYEYVRLFCTGGYRPAGVLVIAGVLFLVLGRALDGFDSAPWMISLIILVSMAYHLLAFERGREQAGTDFALTLAGVLYLGWIGAYFISLRSLPEGKWWVLTVLPAVWIADSGAYFIGRRFGSHKLSPHLSPKKTWGGLLGRGIDRHSGWGFVCLLMGVFYRA